MMQPEELIQPEARGFSQTVADHCFSLLALRALAVEHVYSVREQDTLTLF